MMTTEVPVPTSEQLTERQAAYDHFHEYGDVQGKLKAVRAEAWGDEFPAEIDPASSCTWSVIGEMVGRLRLKPGERLVDLGCGRGGTGLWLARAFNARLIGVDVSARAVQISRRRAPGFLPEGRAEFVQATFERTGLPSGCADGAVSVDALPFAFDRDAALAELRRILRPGARAVFTAGRRLPEHPSYDADEPSWPERAAAAGLEVEAETERPDEPGLWERLYTGVLEHEAQIRAELPEEGARLLFEEANSVGPLLRTRVATLLTVRRPLTD